MAPAPTSDGDPMPAILELRRYTLHPGRRDDLIALFDREFVESHEALDEFAIEQRDQVVAPAGVQSVAAQFEDGGHGVSVRCGGGRHPKRPSLSPDVRF